VPYLHLYGTPIVYDRWGEGPDTVLVGYHAGQWSDCELPPGRRYLAADLPGHGRTPAVVGAGDDDLAEYLVGLLMMLHLTEADLWVHPRARALGRYLSERLGLSVSEAACAGDS